MKILLILFLAAFGLASSHQSDRKAFEFLGQLNSDKSTNTLDLSKYGNIGSLDPSSSSNTKKTSDNLDIVLTNPKRRDVNPGRGFFGFQGRLNQAQSDNRKNKEGPLFVKNSINVLEKEKSSSNEESNESSQQVSVSSSKETNATAVLPSEENSAPNNETASAPANNQEKSSKEAPKSRVNKKKANLFGLQPFGAQKYRISLADKVKRSRAAERRPPRSLDFPGLGIALNNGGGTNVLRPQGGIEARINKQRRLKQ